MVFLNSARRICSLIALGLMTVSVHCQDPQLHPVLSEPGPGLMTPGSSDEQTFVTLPSGKALSLDDAWLRQIGTSGTDQVSSLVVDNQGGIYVGCNTTGAFVNHPNLGDGDGFLLKYRPNGVLDWFLQLGTPGTEVISGIALTKDNQVLVTGYTYGAFPGQNNAGRADVFVAKYSSKGYPIWMQQFGTGEIDRATAISVDGQGSVYVLGTTEGSLPGFTNAGNVDVFLSKFQADGTLLWTKQLGTAEDDTASSALVLQSRALLVGGSTKGAFTGQTEQGREDAWVALYAPDGTQTWLKQFGTSQKDEVTAFAQDDAGIIYAAGNTQGAFPTYPILGSQSGFFLTLQENGTFSKVVQFHSQDQVQQYEVHAITIYQNVVFVAGSRQNVSRPMGDSQAFIVGLSLEGHSLGEKKWGTYQRDYVNAMSLLGDRLYFAGTTYGSFPKEFNQGDSDGFLDVIQLSEK